MVIAPAHVVCGKRTYAVPIQPCANSGEHLKPWLVTLLKQAAELREFVLANRARSMSDLAKAKRMGPSQLARFVRLNYLAPDIQTAIIDGTQPDGITAWDLLNGPMPLDWEQQRQLLGFN